MIMIGGSRRGRLERSLQDGAMPPKKGKQKAQQQKGQQQKGQQQQQGKNNNNKQQQKGKQNAKQQGKKKNAGAPSLAKLGADLRQLVGAQGDGDDGMLMAKLPPQYYKFYKKELKAVDYGFTKLKLLVADLPSFLDIDKRAGGHEWVTVVGGKKAAKRAAADEAESEEPQAKKQKQQQQKQPAAVAAAAASPAEKKSPEELRLLLLTRKEKSRQLTDEQKIALAALREKLGIEAPPLPPAPAAAVAKAAQSKDAAGSKRKPDVLDRLGVKKPAKMEQPGATATADAVRAVETAATTDAVFAAVASAGGAGGVGDASKAVVVSALRRFTELVRVPPNEYDGVRRAVVYNQAFHLLLGDLGRAVIGSDPADLADVFYALQALDFPRDKEFAEEPLLRKLVDELLSAPSPVPPYELAVAVWSLAKLRVRQMDLSLLHKLCDAVPRNSSLGRLDGESVGRLFWALSAEDDLGKPLFAGFRFPQLIR